MNWFALRLSFIVVVIVFLWKRRRARFKPYCVRHTVARSVGWDYAPQWIQNGSRLYKTLLITANWHQTFTSSHRVNKTTASQFRHNFALIGICVVLFKCKVCELILNWWFKSNKLEISWFVRVNKGQKNGYTRLPRDLHQLNSIIICFVRVFICVYNNNKKLRKCIDC